jgi:hypothetical protein
VVPVVVRVHHLHLPDLQHLDKVLPVVHQTHTQVVAVVVPVKLAAQMEMVLVEMAQTLIPHGQQQHLLECLDTMEVAVHRTTLMVQVAHRIRA